MNTDTELISVLNDLVRINHDRAEGYRKAIMQLGPTDIDLATLFNSMASASQENEEALSIEIQALGGSKSDEPPQGGKLYRIWMDIRSGSSPRDRKSILSLAEFGEDAALRAYKMALESETEIPSQLKELIEEQKAAIHSSYEIIKRYVEMREPTST